LNTALSSHRKLAAAVMSIRALVLTKTTQQAQSKMVPQETKIHAITERTDADWLRCEPKLLFHRPISDWRARILCGDSTDFDNDNSTDGSMLAKVR
jgi:hypothetical protein